MSIPLSRVRQDLDRLARRRALARWGTAAATLGLALIIALAATFVVDYVVDLRPLLRGFVLLTIAGVTVWLAGSAVRSLMVVKETPTDVALDVERRRDRARDLVAALQFQSDEAATWGSPQLERSVIGSVDEASRDLDLFENFSWSPLPGRFALLVAAVLLVVLLAVLFPLYASAFFQRLALADVPYPTRTAILSIALNGTPIDMHDPAPLRVAAGSRLQFTAMVEGVRPATGTISMIADGGGTTNVALSPSPPGESNAQTVRQKSHSPAKASIYVGTLDTIRESLNFVVRLGDSETRAKRIELIPRPTVILRLVPNAPAYARANAPAAPPAGVRTAFVLEGSDIAVTVQTVNKPLKNATITVDAANSKLASRQSDRDGVDSLKSARISVPLTASSDGKTWTLEPAGTPFENVRQPLSFTVTVVDRDGLAPAEPLSGSIRLRADRPPRVAATAVVKDVLPAARPTISYGASDDFGLKAVRASIAATRSDGKTDVETIPFPLDTPTAREFQGRHTLDLSSFALQKGDKLVVTVEAEDARGDRPGETAIAEPITFQITDRAGLLATLLETDEDSADRLDAIIRRELGIGEER